MHSENLDAPWVYDHQVGHEILAAVARWYWWWCWWCWCGVSDWSDLSFATRTKVKVFFFHVRNPALIPLSTTDPSYRDGNGPKNREIGAVKCLRELRQNVQRMCPCARC